MMRWAYWFGWLLFGSAVRGLFGLKITGRKHLIREGGVLVASNHESFLDPPLIGCLYQDEMYFLARKSLFRKGVVEWVYRAWNSIPVDQDRPDMASLKTIIRLLRKGDRVLVFPEGERTRDGDLGAAQPGIGLIALKSGAVIQPVRIRGARNALPRGSGRIRLARIEISIGQAIRIGPDEAAALRGKEGYQRVADRIMAAINEL